MRDAHEKIRLIEQQMQQIWGFDPDDTKHTHRHRVPNPEEIIPLYEILKNETKT